MPKLKTHSGTKDRVRITKNGKLLRRHGSIAHNLQKKSASRKRNSAGLEGITGRSSKNMKLRIGA